jgi:uncharacterized protein (TIGR03492 family)
MSKPQRRVLVISNGHGEDQIACRLIAEMHHCHIETLPLAGEGKAYTALGYPPLMTHPPMPSGGFIRSLRDLQKDLSAGLFGTLRQARKKARQHAKKVDVVLAVGDVFCLAMASWGHDTPVYFLPTAKSDTFMPHSMLERGMMKSLAKRIYTRDALTADGLVKHGLSAIYLGNPMMDGLWMTQNPPVFNEDKPVLALVPGSSEEAYLNMVYMLEIAQTLQYDHGCHLVWAKSPELSLTKFITHYPKNTWSFGPNGAWIRDSHGTLVHIVSHFPDVLAVADVVMGLSGTANEQAMHVGKPVYAFEGFGPQSTLKRFKEQKALMGGALHLITPRDAGTILASVAQVIDTRHHMPLAPSQTAAAMIWEDIRGAFSEAVL